MLNPTARSYIAVVIGCGLLILGAALRSLHIADPGLFGLLLLFGLVGSGLKIAVPGVSGNVSLTFLPLVLASILLSVPEAIVITAIATASQVTLFAKKFRPAQAAFNCGALVLSIAAAAQSGALVGDGNLKLIRLAVVGGVYYFANSALVTLVIGFAENKSLSEVWNDCCRLYLPYFATGLAIALLSVTGLTVDERRSAQRPELLVLPLMLLTRHYFKTFCARTGHLSGSGVH